MIRSRRAGPRSEAAAPRRSPQTTRASRNGNASSHGTRWTKRDSRPWVSISLRVPPRVVVSAPRTRNPTRVALRCPPGSPVGAERGACARPVEPDPGHAGEGSASGRHVGVRSPFDAAPTTRFRARSTRPRRRGPLGFCDQTALWGNLGISLLLPRRRHVRPHAPACRRCRSPPLAAVVVGSVIGNLLLGLGAESRGPRPARRRMVLLRGLFGRRGSWVPTAFNIAQNLGWATFEIVIIAEAASQLTSVRVAAPVFVVGAAPSPRCMALRPLGVVRGYLKRVAVWVVLASTAYLFVQVLRRSPSTARRRLVERVLEVRADLVIALPMSWIAAGRRLHPPLPRSRSGVRGRLPRLRRRLHRVLRPRRARHRHRRPATTSSLVARHSRRRLGPARSRARRGRRGVRQRVLDRGVGAEPPRRARPSDAAVVVGVLATVLALVFDNYARTRPSCSCSGRCSCRCSPRSSSTTSSCGVALGPRRGRRPPGGRCWCRGSPASSPTNWLPTRRCFPARSDGGDALDRWQRHRVVTSARSTRR